MTPTDYELKWARAPLEYHKATGDDAEGIAALHADSWRRNYRGAYPDDFLDGPVWEERRTLWTGRLNEPRPETRTIVARAGVDIVGFVHTVLNEDPTWGTLVDNLHVIHELRGRGVGTRLMAEAARELTDQDPASTLHLWVLQQNTAAQAFYEARGGTCVECQRRHPLPGIRLRYFWTEPSRLVGFSGT